MSKELIAKARALAVTGGERDKTIRDLADLAESEGKRADQLRRDLVHCREVECGHHIAERDMARNEVKRLDAALIKSAEYIAKAEAARDEALAELARLKGPGSPASRLDRIVSSLSAIVGDNEPFSAEPPENRLLESVRRMNAKLKGQEP